VLGPKSQEPEEVKRIEDFKKLRAIDQNIPPGTVVDRHLVNPKYAEFYLCSHLALQGTANVPRYTVIYNENGLSMDQIELRTWYLSFGYQIVSSTVSLPAPSYIAMRYAERGRMLLKEK